MLRLIPLLLIVGLGAAGVVVFGYYALVDWDALEKAYGNFSALAQGSPAVTSLLAAEAQQNIHRINLFAEGVWVLQSATLSAIGLHGICTMRR
ncbi:MAG: hypothetical protein VKK04_10145 [Synechococcales bacterium]|nr:hypothetical protein [Synechococcales bacterium]